MNNYSTEKQVCTLEQAKELAELLGENAPESLWVWQKIIDPILKTTKWVPVLRDKLRGFLVFFIPAYTGDELGALLPTEIYYKRKLYFRCWKIKKGWMARYNPIPRASYWCLKCTNQIESQAKAALAIKGLKEGWIKKEDFQYN